MRGACGAPLRRFSPTLTSGTHDEVRLHPLPARQVEIDGRVEDLVIPWTGLLDGARHGGPRIPPALGGGFNRRGGVGHAHGIVMTMSVQPAPYRFTVDEYERMGATGVFDPDDRLELIDGEIVIMAPIGSRHAGCVDRLNHLLFVQVGDRVVVRVQNPIRLGPRSEPQPDLALLRPRDDFYAAAHPGPADVLLVVEVADATLNYDLGAKAALYARSGIATLWVIDLAGRGVNVLSEPTAGGFRTATRATAGDSVVVDGLDDATVAVVDVLGPS